MTNVKNTIITAKPVETKTFSAFLNQDAVKNKINEMVGGKDGQRFITSIISAVSTNVQLIDCEKSSILSAAMLGEALKLSPSPQLGQYYLVPYSNNKTNTKVAQFQIGYKGLIQLAIRSGQYKNINVVALKEGEVLSYNPLTEELKTKFIEDETQREEAETIGYYAMFELINGFTKSIYWSKKKMEAHAKEYSQAYRTDINKNWNNSFWTKSFDDMAFKTLLRQLLSKWGVMSIELQEAYQKDQSLIKEDGTVVYVDNNIDDNEPITHKEEDLEKGF